MRQATKLTIGITLGLLGTCLFLPQMAAKRFVSAAAMRAEGKESILGRWDFYVQGSDG
jgi:hypothetical protein